MKSSGSADPEIQFCDNHLLVAVKPAGWLTQPDESGRESLEVFAKEWVKKKYQKPGNVFLHCIHRLDRPVSGLVLFARTSKALSRLNEMSRNQEIQRIYTAEVEGILSQKRAVLDHYLIHGDYKALVSKPSHPEAKRALLSYIVKEERDHSTVVSIELDTGRYHQIRAQFGAIGHPIVGDEKYGAKPKGFNEIALTCTQLALNHPVTKELLKFSFNN